MSDVLNTKVDEYYAARQSYEEAKAESDRRYAQMCHFEAELVNYMLDNQIKGIDREDGTKPSLVRSTSISVTKDNFEEIRKWLQATEGDDKDFLDTIVSKPAVLELVKRKIEKDLMDPSEFPACLSVSTRPNLRVNGWKSR